MAGSGTHDDLMTLSKDIGKLGERTARLEEGSAGLRDDVADMKKAMTDGFAALAAREKDRGERDQKIADHMSKVCTFAKLGIFFLKFVFPSGGLIGLLAAIAKIKGWL